MEYCKVKKVIESHLFLNILKDLVCENNRKQQGKFKTKFLFSSLHMMKISKIMNEMTKANKSFVS
jgi:hypothetical protein